GDRAHDRGQLAVRQLRRLIHRVIPPKTSVRRPKSAASPDSWRGVSWLRSGSRGAGSPTGAVFSVICVTGSSGEIVVSVGAALIIVETPSASDGGEPTAV